MSKMLQALPLDVKIKKTQLRIQEWYEKFDGQVYVAESGGKDSKVLSHIIKNMYPDVPNVFVNTGLEYDSVRKHGKKIADEILKPSMRFDEVIIKYGYPIISKEISCTIRNARKNIIDGNENTCRVKKLRGIDQYKKGSLYNSEKYNFLLDAPFKISEQCCDIMKKKPSKEYEKSTERKVILGTMADESKLRKSKWIKSGCNAVEQERPTSQPLSFWTEQDILHYIKLYSLEIASVYGGIVYMDNDGMQYENSMFDLDMKLVTTGESRTGCVFCMFGINQDKERFLRLKEIDIKKYNFVMNGGEFDECGMWIPSKDGLGYKFIIDWLNEHGNLGIKY